jgi:hypothetical protein
VPKFRVLSDPGEQIAAYRADGRQKAVTVPPEVLESYTRSVDLSNQSAGQRADRSPQTHHLGAWRSKWRTIFSDPAAKRYGPKWNSIAAKLRLVQAKISDVLDNEESCHLIRHLVMRGSLGTVLAWFAAQQLSDPDGWVHFVPSFMQGVAGLPEPMLIRLHGTLLLVASVGLLSGTRVRLAAGLAAFILVQIIAALAINGGEANLVARDVGLLGLALGLAFDPTRSSARETSSTLVSLPPSPQQALAPPPMVAHLANGAAAYAASGAGTIMRGARSKGNGNGHPFREAWVDSDAQLVAQTDEQLVRKVLTETDFLEDAASGDSDRSEQRMAQLTDAITRLTWVIAGLTLVNLIAMILAAAALLVALSHGG